MKKYIVNGKDVIAELKEQSPIPVLCSTPRQCKKMVKNHRRMYWSITGAGFYSNKACNGWYKNELNMPDTFIWINSQLKPKKITTTLIHEMQHASCDLNKCHCHSSNGLTSLKEMHAFYAELVTTIHMQIPQLLFQCVKSIQLILDSKTKYDDPSKNPRNEYIVSCETINRIPMYKQALKEYRRNRHLHHSKIKVNWIQLQNTITKYGSFPLFTAKSKLRI